MTPTRSSCVFHQDRGFTLLELLVALSLLVLIAVYLSAGIGTGRRVWDVRAKIESQEASTAIREFLRQRIEDIWPAHKRIPSGEIRLLFEGDANRLEFVSTLGTGSNWSGLYRFVVEARQEDGLAHLEISGDVFRPSEQSSPAKFQRPLLTSIKDVEFRYFGPPDPEASPVWSATWSHSQGLPWLVAISIAFPDGDPRNWTELVIPLRLAQRN